MTTPMTHRLRLLGLAAGISLALATSGAAPLAADVPPPSAPPVAEDGADDAESPAAEEQPFPWVADFKAASAQAKAEGKDLFINFTGSDWCGWCVRLDKEVFSQGDFAARASEHFVFVYMDFPNAAELKAKVVDTALRDGLKQRYGVEGFPTILLTFADGTPYARTAYAPDGPEPYLANLAALRAEGAKAKVLLEKKEKASVAEIKAAIPGLAKGGFLGDEAYAWVLERIPVLDPKGDLGLLPLHQAHMDRQAVKAIITELMARQSAGQPADWDAVHKKLLAVNVASLVDSREEGLYLDLYFGAAQWLLGEGRCDDARAAAEVLKSHRLLKENERAQQMLAEFLEKVEAKASGAGDDDEGDEGMDDEGGDDDGDEPEDDDAR
jgi:thiol-disulfide isomerase/thioredoxin